MKRLGQFWMLMIGILLTFSGCGKDVVSQSKEGEDALLTQTAAESAMQEGPFRMTFLATGKSDCIVMEIGDYVVVNDTADADDGAAICAYLEERQVERITYLILSHFDKDHIGSAAVLLSEFEVDCVLMPDYEEDSEAYLMLLQALERTGTEERRLLEDYSFTLEDAAFYVNAPEEDAYENDNNYSLITTVTYKDTRFLLMGDAMKKRTGEFMDSDAGQERYDLIKMPHHGDYNKKLAELFAIARPDYVVLTADEARQRVEEKTIELLEQSGCGVFYTDAGNITVLSDGSTVTLLQ